MTVEQNFSRLVERYQKERLSKEKRLLVDDFFDSMANQDDTNNPARTDLDKLILKTKILHQIESDEKNKSSKGRTRALVVWLRAAAAFFILTSSYFAWQWYQPAKHNSAVLRKYSRASEVVKVILSDGSIVWLKGNSSLSYPEEFESNRRKVALEGDAVFEVTKNPEAPFVIKFEGITAQVLGTSFGISSGQGKTELTVLTGRVLVSSEEADLLIMPHEKAIYDRQQKHLTKEGIPKNEESSIANGTEYNMHFEDTQMKDILARIESKFDVHVNVTDRHIYNCVLTADLTDQPLERTLSIVAQTLRCKYKVQDREIFIEGTGCE